MAETGESKDKNMAKQTPETKSEQPKSSQSELVDQAEANKYRINHYIKIEEEILKCTDEEGVLDLDKIESEELRGEVERYRNQAVGGLAREIAEQRKSKKHKIKGGSRNYGYDSGDLQKAEEQFTQDSSVRLAILNNRIEKLNELTSYSSEGLLVGQYEDNPDNIIKSLNGSISAKDIEIKKKEMEAEKAQREREEKELVKKEKKRAEEEEKQQAELAKKLREYAWPEESKKKEETETPAPAEKSAKEQAIEKAKGHFKSLEKVEVSAKVINLQAEYQLFIKGEIKEKPDISQEELLGYLLAAQQECKMEDNDKWVESETKHIENYIIKRKEIVGLKEKHKNNKLALIKELLGVDISEEDAGKIKIEYGPTNIRIFVNTGERKEDEQVAENRDLFRKLASLNKEAESAEVGGDVRDSIISRNIERKGKPNCVIYDVNHRAVEWSEREDKKESHGRYGIDKLKNHEEDGHSKFLLRNQELTRSLKKGSLGHALFWAQSETCSSCMNNETTERFVYKLIEGMPGFGTYDYAGQLKNEKDKISYYERVKKVLLPQEGEEMSLLDKLAVAIGGNREKAVALLTREYIALERWPKEIDSIIKAYGKEAEDRINKEREKRERKATKKKEATKEESKDELSAEELVEAIKEEEKRIDEIIKAREKERRENKDKEYWSKGFWGRLKMRLGDLIKGRSLKQEIWEDVLGIREGETIKGKAKEAVREISKAGTKSFWLKDVRDLWRENAFVWLGGKKREKEGNEGGKGKAESDTGESVKETETSAESNEEKEEKNRENEFEEKFNELYFDELYKEIKDNINIGTEDKERLILYIKNKKSEIENSMDRILMFPEEANELVSYYGIWNDLADKILVNNYEISSGLAIKISYLLDDYVDYLKERSPKETSGM